MATLTAVAGHIYDGGVHDPDALAAALVKATKVSALQAKSAAAGVIAARSKTVATTPTSTTTTAGGATTGAVVTDVALSGVGDAATAARNLFEWLTDQGTWIRIGYVVLGGALIILGAKVLVEGAVVNTATKYVGTAVKEISTGEG